MGALIGIDLGTTNSCLAIFEGQGPHILANAEGGRTTPSVVSFGEDVLVGEAALRFRVLDPESTVSSVKRLIGRRHEEVAGSDSRIVPGPEGTVRIELPGGQISPEEVSARVIGKLLADAQSYLDETVEGVVITVPAHFDDGQRQATVRAAELAGVEVIRLLNEPTAAALAYGRGKEDQVLAVFDLGGGTFDISVLEVGEGVFEVLATAGDINLGGDDFDRVLVGMLKEAWLREKGLSLHDTADSSARLLDAARAAKHELSGLERTLVSLPFLEGEEGLEAEVTRAGFEAACAPLLERLRSPLAAVLEETGVRPDELLFVGGMTRMPAVRLLAEETVHLQARSDVQPDEAVALGAALQAASLQGQDNALLLDVTPLSLGIETDGRVMRRLIEANSTIPIRVSEIFTTSEDNQPSVDIRILQGEHSLAEENRLLGEINLIGIPPAIAGVPQIEICFDLDADGVLSVSARDLTTGQEQAVRLQGTSSLPAEMIEELKINEQEIGRDLQERGYRLALARRRRLTEVLKTLLSRVENKTRQRLAGALHGLQTAEEGPAVVLAVRKADEELRRALESGLLKGLAGDSDDPGRSAPDNSADQSDG